MCLWDIVQLMFICLYALCPMRACLSLHVCVSWGYTRSGSRMIAGVGRRRDMMMATLRMAGFQPRISHQILGLALRPAR